MSDETYLIEVWYCWRELGTVEGETTPRFLVPWSDPFAYEFPFDFIYESIAKAIQAKADEAPDEDWILCRQTTEVAVLHTQTKE